MLTPWRDFNTSGDPIKGYSNLFIYEIYHVKQFKFLGI